MPNREEGWLASTEHEGPKDMWAPMLQVAMCIFDLPVWFDTEEGCLSFIRDEILGQGMLDV